MITTRTGRNSDQFTLRLPNGVRKEVKNIALANRRTMNAELLCLIELGMSVASKKCALQYEAPMLQKLDRDREGQP